VNEYQELAARLLNLEKRVAGMGGLGNSSLEDSAVNEYDLFGTPMSTWGKQWDGTHGIVPLNGPKPPTPGAISVSIIPGALLIEWLGEWDPEEVVGSDGVATPVVAPSDFARVEVHVSTSPDLSGLLRETLKTVISTPRGAEVRVDLNYDETYYVRLVTRATTGQVSEPSPVFGPYTIPQLTQADIGIDFSAIGGNTIFFGAATPTTTKTGDIWNKWVNSPTTPAKYEVYRWDGDSWEFLQDQSAVQAALAAEAAQAAADAKARIFSQASPPAGLTPTDKAIWIDTDAGNASYWWDGDSWEPRLIGNAAIQPNSLVASDVIATGTVTAALLQAILVLATTIIAGTSTTVAHTRIDSSGVTAIAYDADNLPVEVGRFGAGWGVRNPTTGDIVGSMTDEGDLSARSLTTLDGNPSFGGTPLSTILWDLPKGVIAYGKLPSSGSNSATTNTELGFIELGFIAEAGRSYAVHMEPLEVINITDTGAAKIRVRQTLDGSAPTVSSSLLQDFTFGSEADASWNYSIGGTFLYNGPAAGSSADNVRLLFTYASGTGSAVSQGTTITRGQNQYFWVEDIGPTVPETGNESSGGGTSTGGTAPPSGGTTPKTNYVWESTANWVRTWNQGGSVIYDDEMHQGYGDSFNGIRRSSAGWTVFPSLTGATVTSLEIYLESYYWWNMAGGLALMGYHGATSEPASFPGLTGGFNTSFTSRSQGKWISTAWHSLVIPGTFKGISLYANSTSNTYYGKFRGPAYARPRLKLRYTK
jgi:hypothetical protein